MALRLLPPVVAVSSLAFAGSVFAQHPTVLAPVVASVTRVEQKLSDVIPSATVISREQIERAQAPNLVDLLHGEMGLEIGRAGGPGTQSSFFIRGQNSVSVAIFIDGVRVQTDALGTIRLIDLAPSQIERIELVRGNVGAIYGEAAIGGAIHIITRTSGSGTTLSASYGSRDTSDLTLSHQQQQQDYRWGVSAQRFETAGYSTLAKRLSPSVNSDHDGYRREALFLYGERRLNEALSFGMQANTVANKVEYDLLTTPSFAPATANDAQRAKSQSSDVTAYANLNISPVWSSRLALTQSDFASRDYYNGVANGRFDAKQQSVQWSNRYDVGPGAASLGAEFGSANYHTPTRYDRDTAAIYLGYAGRIQRLDYQLNVRQDEIRAKSSTQTLEQSADTWLVGAGLQLTDQLKLTALASTSFRAPSAGELLGTSFTTANPQLKPEQHQGYEVGLLYSLPNATLRLVRFVTDTSNAIDYQYDPATFSATYVNIAALENAGYEMSLNGSLSNWRYRLNATAQDPNVPGSAVRPARRAKYFGSVDLNTTWQSVDWGAKVIWSGDRADFDVVTFAPTQNAAYTVVNLYAAKALTKQLTGRVKIDNAFDEHYQFANGYDAMPLGVFVAVDYRLQ